MTTITGLHHVTAIASDPQANVDFYRGVLGLRLVKLTVNFDDPTSYHLYYGDGVGYPGTILTFFAWPGGVARGRVGAGQTAATTFSIAPDSLAFWRDRLATRGIAVSAPEARFGEHVLHLTDPDGLALELAAHPRAAERAGWVDGPVPAEHAIRGLHGVSLREADATPTAEMLTDTLGFQAVAQEGAITRYAVGAGGPGAFVDVQAVSAGRRGLVAVGTVHHVAWRTPDDAAQLAWRARLVDERHHVSPVMDREYFHSIYFREPGGVLFEIATDPPGFTVDEPAAELGTHLKLPPWLEPDRAVIAAALPKLRLDDAR
jgi:glyoxalase family protein